MESISKYHFLHKYTMFVNSISIKRGWGGFCFSGFIPRKRCWYISISIVFTCVYSKISYNNPISLAGNWFTNGHGTRFVSFPVRMLTFRTKDTQGDSPSLSANCCEVNMRRPDLWHPSCNSETLNWEPSRHTSTLGRMKRNLGLSVSKSPTESWNCSP